VADAASRRALGNTTLAREDARSVWRWAAIERLWQDVGYGARMLRRNPSFTGVAVMTLALGIGATTAMFSVVNAVLLRPLPFHDPDRLVAVSIADPWRDIREAGTSLPTVNDWRTQSQRFTDLAIWATAAARIHTASEPERVALFAVVALALAAVGIYGVVQFAAAQRMKELGIRVALGARGLDLVRLMMSQGLRLPLIGLAIGLLGAYLLVGVPPKAALRGQPRGSDYLRRCGTAAGRDSDSRVLPARAARFASRSDRCVAERIGFQLPITHCQLPTRVSSSRP
jgi:hypothetical protein